MSEKNFHHSGSKIGPILLIIIGFLLLITTFLILLQSRTNDRLVEITQPSYSDQIIDVKPTVNSGNQPLSIINVE